MSVDDVERDSVTTARRALETRSKMGSGRWPSKVLRYGFLFCCAPVFLVVFAIFSAPWHWAADLVVNFLPHLLVYSIIVFLVSIRFAPRWLRIVLLAAFCFQLWTVVRPIDGPDVVGMGEASDLTLISFNISAWHEDRQRVVNYLAKQNVDLLILQEAGGRWLNTLASLDNLYPFKFGPRKQGPKEYYILSRLPIAGVKQLQFFDRSGEPISGLAIRVVLELGEDRLVIYGVHPLNPVTKQRWQQRNAYLQALARHVADEPAHSQILIAGDFNMTPWSPFYDRSLSQMDLVDAAGSRLQQPTRRPGWPVTWRWLGVPIDHLWITRGIAVEHYEIGPELGSDHFPIIATLRIPNQK